FGSIRKSANNGSSWTNFSTGLGSAIVLDLLVSGSDIYAACGTQTGTGAGVYKSPLSAANFSNLSSGIPNYTVISLAKIGSTIYAGTESGVYKSTNSAVSWTPESNGITYRTINDLLAIGNSLVAATDSGIYKLESGSSNWTNISFNLPIKEVSAIARNNDYLYAATQGGSVWQIPSFLVGVNEFYHSNSAFEIYPNPCSWELFISDPLLRDETMTINIYNVIGEEIFNLATKSSQSFIDVSKFENGIYFVQLSSGNKTTTQKLVIQH
ncbi:T9SS type A sorting domain-containing protein, partial [Dolichospermum sp. ST_sed3]|nr:T9SS type A sorting domain-containing protein [Dolichospermum sp. ST_sed3]